MEIKKIAAIKHGNTHAELRRAFGQEPSDSSVIHDSIIGYTDELVRAVGDRELLCIGRGDHNKEYHSGGITARSYYSRFNRNKTPLLIRIFRRWLVDRRIARDLARFSPDLILSFGFYNEQPLAHRVAVKCGAIYVPVVVGTRIEPEDPIRKIAWRRFVPTIKDPDIPRILVRGEFLRDHLVEGFGIDPEKIRVYWPEYPESFFQGNSGNPFSEDRFEILWLGRLDRGKGCQHLPGIFKRIITQIPDCRLNIVGKGRYEDILRGELEEIDPSGLHWEMHGYVPSSEVEVFFSNCDAFISTTLSEGFGKTIYEAMLCGTPVVANPVDNIPYLVEDGESGFLVDTSDFAATAKILRVLSDNPALSRKLGKAARKKAKNLGGASFEQEIIKLIEEIESK